MDAREPLDCGWMVPPGSYQDMVRNLIESNPGLLRRERKRTMDGPVRAFVFELPRSKPAHLPTPITLNSAEELREHVDKAERVAQGVNSIYIMENLNRGGIEVLGRHFNLHPSIFLDYVRSTQVPGCKRGYSSLLASTCATRDYLVLNYRELLALPDEAASLERLRCAHTGRDIATTFINCDLDMVGVVNRRAVLWSRQRTTKDGWDCLVICDPPVQSAQVSGGIPGAGSKFYLCPKGRSYLDGYVDFVPGDVQASTRRGPPRTCLADDLVFYISTHGNLVGMDTPDAVALFVQKIVASHYTQFFDYFRRKLRDVQRFMRQPSDPTKSDLSAVEANWVEVQKIERRLDKGRMDLEEILLQIGAPLELPNPGIITSWRDVSADFRLIYHRLIYLQQSAERVNASITGLASIVGNRQAFKEQQLSLHAAEKSRGLTFIGLVFIPLAFVSSLFSMAEPYGPGGELFWIYFVISVPTSISVMALYYIFNLGYRADGSGWSITNLGETWKWMTVGGAPRGGSGQAGKEEYGIQFG